MIRLREVGGADLAALVAIGPDREAWLAYGGDPARGPVGGEPWARTILDRLRAAPWGRAIEVDGTLAGEIRLHSLHRTDRSARLALGLFRPAQRGRGIGRAAIALALDHAFGPMDLHRVDLRVLAGNIRAIRCYKAAGFRHEGLLRDAARTGATWQDEQVMAILAHDPRPARP